MNVTILKAELEIANIKLRYAKDKLARILEASASTSFYMLEEARERLAILNQEQIIAQARLDELVPPKPQPDKPTSFEEAKKV